GGADRDPGGDRRLAAGGGAGADQRLPDSARADAGGDAAVQPGDAARLGPGRLPAPAAEPRAELAARGQGLCGAGAVRRRLHRRGVVAAAAGLNVRGGRFVIGRGDEDRPITNPPPRSEGSWPPPTSFAAGIFPTGLGPGPTISSRLAWREAPPHADYLTWKAIE